MIISAARFVKQDDDFTLSIDHARDANITLVRATAEDASDIEDLLLEAFYAYGVIPLKRILQDIRTGEVYYVANGHGVIIGVLDMYIRKRPDAKTGRRWLSIYHIFVRDDDNEVGVYRRAIYYALMRFAIQRGIEAGVDEIHVVVSPRYGQLRDTLEATGFEYAFTTYPQTGDEEKHVFIKSLGE